VAPPEDSSRFLKPSAIDQAFSRVFGLLVLLGIGFSHNYLLEVRGRKSGRLYSTPVDVLDLGGKRFLVAPRGQTQWARNAQASGKVRLKRALVGKDFAVRSVADSEKPEILKGYLDSFKTTVQRFFPVAAGSPAANFVALAPDYPVFELVQED
jgi:deazaflavin-dependent oxidoreductase (nitroreductase family)